ncbi:nodal homolog [Liolophura sinensis]|uniref:nodal homolog n=1 Tax=Liolophura sinensis TaxID=3198878 RepID=UPI003158D2EF
MGRETDGYRSIDYTKTTSRFMLELFSKLQKGEHLSKASGHIRGSLDILSTDTVRCFSATAFHRDSSQKASFEFRVPRLPRNERLSLAEFRIPIQNQKKHSRKLKLHLRRGLSPLRTFSIRVKPFSDGDNKYLVYDITSSLRSLVNGYHGNITVRIHVRDQAKGNYSVDPKARMGTVGNPQEGLLVFYSENRGFLEAIYSSYTEEGQNDRGRRHGRQRRSLITRRRSRKNKNKWSAKKSRKSGNLCQKFDFYVDFNKIGWGRWIVFPKRFNAFLCHGNCPSPIASELLPTNHAMMQSLMRQKRPNAAPMPCCVPSKLKPLSMLYYEYDEILVRHHENMIAEECSCR